MFGYASYGSARHIDEWNAPAYVTYMQELYYVYILRSDAASGPHFYTGFTRDAEKRLVHHNSGGDPYTAKYRPWRLKTYLAFSDREQALNFERYLKTLSGRAFAKKRL